MMIREESLWAMKGSALVALAQKLGVKVAASNGQLKESKHAVVVRILAQQAKEAEKNPEKKEEAKSEPKTKPMPKMMPIPGGEKLAELKAEYSKPKRGQLIEYNGKAQNICAWAKELGISANTLYGRLYKMHWTVEKAFGGK